MDPALLALAIRMTNALGYPHASSMPLVAAAAAVVSADPRPLYGSKELELADVLEWLHKETGFTMAPAKRLDNRAYCAAQIRDRPELAGDERACVAAMVGIIHANADLCGDDRAMASYSSGRCDAATVTARVRERDAWLVLELAR
jgi:hypothetical protein